MDSNTFKQRQAAREIRLGMQAVTSDLHTYYHAMQEAIREYDEQSNDKALRLAADPESMFAVDQAIWMAKVLMETVFKDWDCNAIDSCLEAMNMQDEAMLLKREGRLN